MAWSPQQEEALRAVGTWLKDGAAPQVFRLFGFAGSGKAQPLSAMVQTPFGPRAMGEMEVGNTVCGSSGPTRITGVFPQGKKMAYRVMFRDGSSTVCSIDHLWRVQTPKDRQCNRWRTLTLREILEVGLRFNSGAYRWQIPLCDPVEYWAPRSKFDAYTMGVLIGDGALAGNVVEFAKPDVEIAERVEKALPVGMTLLRSDYGPCPHFALRKREGDYLNPWRQHLLDVGLCVPSKEKFIPDEYLLGSAAGRLELLRGLMDTDGSARSNRVSFSTSSERLADNVVTLVQSLGGTAIKKTYIRGSGDTDFHVNVKMSICPFHLKRKADLWRPSKKNPPSRYIVAVEEVGLEEQRCISVDAPDSLYLTDAFIVTHNSTLAREMAQGVKGGAVYCAFTGKAALVMRRKGCPEASTVHSAIYKVDEDEESDEPRFILNPDCTVATAGLVVLDECSMISEDLGKDLLSFGTKVLVLGDPAQLPPVRGEGFFTAHEPDVMLTEIHRQAADNPIIDLATKVRLGERLVAGTYGESRVISRAEVREETILGADQVLVGRNRTREGMNRWFRKKLGRASDIPVVGDRLVCLRNDKEKRVLNGELFDVVDAPPLVPGQAPPRRRKDSAAVDLWVKSEESTAARPKDVRVRREFFVGGADDLSWQDRRGYIEMTFGWALTAHKAQGSQWSNVLVRDESEAFREHRRNWLYTAITRAAERVTVVTE